MYDYDLKRMQEEYIHRKERLGDAKLYSAFDVANLFLKQQRQKELIHLLQKLGVQDLKQKKILEIGCGIGSVLIEFMSLGARSRNLYGVDIIRERVSGARKNLPGSTILYADAQNVPLPSQSFDIVTQFTALSSILSEDIRQNVVQEMKRLVRPDGVIIWYDFLANPKNQHTRGIRPIEINRYFSDCKTMFRRITLAPPVARKIVPYSWLFAVLLEKITLLNSHYLVAISPPPP
jgi:ubiquinone/menaquinone biosynthesis C-methylase UbiE